MIREQTLIIREQTLMIREQTLMIREQTLMIGEQTLMIRDRTLMIRDQTLTDDQLQLNAKWQPPLPFNEFLLELSLRQNVHVFQRLRSILSNY